MERVFVLRSGQEVHGFEAGDGELAVLLHSGVGSSAQWKGAMRTLRDHVRVLALDLSGHGRTLRPPGLTSENLLAHERDLVLEVIAQEGAPVHLVGHSYGGVVAMFVAAAAPRSVRTLTLIEPAALSLLATTGAEHYDRVLDLHRRFEAMVVAGDHEAAMAFFMDHWNQPGLWPMLPAPMRAAIAAMAESTLIGVEAALLRPIDVEALHGWEKPAAVLMGTQSPAALQIVARTLASRVLDCELVVVPDASHMLPVTHAEVVARHVLRVTGARACRAQMPPVRP